MNTVKLFTLAKMAYAANQLQSALGQAKPLNFKVGESNMRDIMEDCTAANFNNKLVEHPDFERVLGLFSTKYAFIPVETQDEYIEALSDLSGWVTAQGFRFSVVCPVAGDDPAYYLPVARKLLEENGVTLTANIDPYIQEAFETVEVTEQMSESKYKRKLISALHHYFGEGMVVDPIWSEDELTFELEGLPFTQHGLPVDAEDEDQDEVGED